MKVNVIGGGPGGLFAALLLKKDDPERAVEVYERNRADDTFGFGVVFSDATLEEVAQADPETFRAIAKRFHHWDDIDIHYQGELLRSTGHGFAGVSRTELLLLLHRRCREEGVGLHFEAGVDDVAPYLDADLVIGADGINSTVRERFSGAFEPSVDERRNRFVWLGDDEAVSGFHLLLPRRRARAVAGARLPVRRLGEFHLHRRGHRGDLAARGDGRGRRGGYGPFSVAALRG